MDNESSDWRIDRKHHSPGNGRTGDYLSLHFSDYGSYRGT